MTDVYLLTGSNVGDRKNMLQRAERMLTKRIGRLTRKSALYETAPWGLTDQADFLNRVLVFRTPLPAFQILETILETEEVLGRIREKKWGPRTIDIDILYFGNEIIHRENLIIPHPELHKRRFTLVPLHEIAPTFVHPILHRTQQELLEQCADASEVRTADD